MEKKNVSKNKTTKKGNIEKARLNTVEPIEKRTNEPVVKSTKIEKQVVEPIEKRTNEPVVKSTKIEKQVVEPIEKQVVEPIEKRTNEPVVKSTKIEKQLVEPIEKRTNEPVVKPVIKLYTDKTIINSVEPVEKDNKISCDQLKNMNESHKKILKKCTDNNFNIFD